MPMWIMFFFGTVGCLMRTLDGRVVLEYGVLRI
jgi:hypothetical protein